MSWDFAGFGFVFPQCNYGEAPNNLGGTADTFELRRNLSRQVLKSPKRRSISFFLQRDELAALGDRFAQELLTKKNAAIAKKKEEDWKGSWRRGRRPGSLATSIQFGYTVILSSCFRAGVDAGAWSIEDPRFTAVFLFSGLHGVVDDTYTREKRVNRSWLVQRLERLRFHAVGVSLG